MAGKPELKLAFQSGALLIINGLKIELDQDTKDKMTAKLDEEFELWYENARALMDLFV